MTFTPNTNTLFHFTHDIDWLIPHHPVSILKTLSGKQWLHLPQLFRSDIFLRHAEDIFRFESTHGISTVNHIGIQKKVNTLRRTGIRYSYESTFLKEFISICRLHKVQTGLHVNTLESIPFQVEQYIHLTGHTPEYIRTHYFSQLSKQQLHELQALGVKYDFSAGGSTVIGISNDSTHHPLSVIPTIISDNNFVRFKNHADVFQKFDHVLQSLVHKPQHVAVLIHPENLLAYPYLQEIYLRIIDTIKQYKFEFASHNSV
ncbi:MAG: hypothetical protein ACK574_08185 [Bacteroidota bacterium]